MQQIALNDITPTKMQRQQMNNDLFKLHEIRVHKELKELGAVQYDLLLPETRALPFIIHPEERITGIVFGRYRRESAAMMKGRGALVATDRRMILVDKKPLFLRYDEIGYHVVSGVSYTSVGISGTVTLHTRVGDVNVRTFNKSCADTFVKAVEKRVFENPTPTTIDSDY